MSLKIAVSVDTQVLESWKKFMRTDFVMLPLVSVSSCAETCSLNCCIIYWLPKLVSCKQASDVLTYRIRDLCTSSSYTCRSIYIFSLPHILHRVRGCLESTIGWGLGGTQGRGNPVHTHTFTYIFTIHNMDIFEMPASLQSMSLYWRRKTKYLEETPEAQRTCKLH